MTPTIDIATALPMREGTNQIVISRLNGLISCIKGSDDAKRTYVMESKTYRNRTCHSPTILLSHSRAKRPTVKPGVGIVTRMRKTNYRYAPPKKPDEMYPDEEPPPRTSIMKVTIQPEQKGN